MGAVLYILPSTNPKQHLVKWFAYDPESRPYLQKMILNTNGEDWCDWQLDEQDYGRAPFFREEELQSLVNNCLPGDTQKMQGL